MASLEQAKSMAKLLRSALSDRQVDVTHGAALEIVAAQLGFGSWNVACARMGEVAAAEIAFTRTCPILRIFDADKAREFYLGFLGFTLDWEHRFGENYPLYAQVSRAGLSLHLSEHHGDASPGSTVSVTMRGVRALQQELASRDYRFAKPAIEELPWGLGLTVTDPFSNRIRFIEPPGA